ncbi:AbrB/MazE/SpoVT family DNA-binding domain-containing protein [Candidatus Bathyarchaeota archaeon]|nr:AbrB/MazE/SpoVT family DNA-binding domain-containing protein [Candidatus Bathyarchaeota archaeon]
MEIKIGNKGRITIPSKLRALLGIKEGDVLTIEASGDAILLKPKGLTVEETWGLLKVGKVEINEIEEAAGKEESCAS